MSRYTGPRLRKMRALGRELPGLARKKVERRPYRPGQHGLARRRKISDYGLRLIEKQSLRFNYGVTETQLRNLMDEALKSKDPAISLRAAVEVLDRGLGKATQRIEGSFTGPETVTQVSPEMLRLAAQRLLAADATDVEPRP